MVEKHLATGWTFRQKSGGEWRQARVPGHVHDDLVRHGVIQDPFYRMNERDCQWVDQEDWVYRCRFEWAPAVGMPRKVLRFEGLDTVATVFLNGEKIAESDNMFLPFEVDVAETLRVGENEIVIEFQSAVRVAEERRAAYLKQEGIDPSVFTFYERSFVRKAQYMFGWDWGPRLVSCGIWKPIVLLEYDSRITDVWARPRKVGDRKWEVEVSWEGERADIEFECNSRIDGWTQNSNSMYAYAFVEDPVLWTPGQGYQFDSDMVYLQTFKFGSHTKEIITGFRTVELLREPDEWGESFEFLINGQPMFCKGANWIPARSLPSRDIDYENSVHTMLDANFNMIRIWGGGLYEHSRFFDYCDQWGLMVWQDFPFACAYYPEDEATLTSVEREARANIKRLRNHPSLVLWCGNNENQQMHEQKWGGDKSPERFYGEKIYDELLPRILKEEDPDRQYVHGSPSGKVEGKDSNMDGVGDSHYWDVWHGRGDWKHYEDSKSRFCSEFGFASSPSLYTWSKTIDKEDWKFDSEAVKWHDKTLKGYAKYISYIELHYPKIETLEDLVYYSQLNQRDAMRCALEHFRRSEACKGTLIWQFNDCWPVQSWSLVDYYDEGHYTRKPALDEVLRLYANTCSCITQPDGRMRLYMINDVGYDMIFDIRQDNRFHFGGKALYDMVNVNHLRSGQWGVMDTKGNYLDCEIRIIETLCKSRKVTPVAEFDTSQYDPSYSFFFMTDSLQNYPRLSNVRLFCEPKNYKGKPGKIVISVGSESGNLIKSDLPAIDLALWDPDLDNRPYGDWIPLLLPGRSCSHSPSKFYSGPSYEPKRLVARSLAGYHEVEITRSPL